MTSTVAFPRARPSSSMSVQSVVSIRQATALEVCEIVYASGSPPARDTLERIYESNAGNYENPLVTAPSRALIANLYTLSSQWTALRVPRPLATLYALLRLTPPKHVPTHWELVRAWTEVGDVWESESFDGHKRCIVEHTLHVLFLPNLHSTSAPSTGGGAPGVSDSTLDIHLGGPSLTSSPPVPSLSIPGTSLGLPSPLHATLAVTSRLSFNDAGRITHHRDLWDARDLVRLLPGGALVQWAASRAAGSALGLAGWFTGLVFGRHPVPPREAVAAPHPRYDVESAMASPSSSSMTPAQAYASFALER